MDPQTSINNKDYQNSRSNGDQPKDSAMEFQIGSEVIYGLNGKCQIEARETKTVGGQPIEFFKLRVLKGQLSRSKKEEPHIWAPVDQAEKQGMRPIMSVEQIEQIMEIIESEEIFFDVEEDFRSLSKKLENCIFKEGPIGLAKVVSFFEGYRIKHPIPEPEVNRFEQMIFKLLTREMAEVQDTSIKSQEERLKKGLSNKVLLEPETDEENND